MGKIGKWGGGIRKDNNNNQILIIKRTDSSLEKKINGWVGEKMKILIITKNDNRQMKNFWKKNK